MANITQYLNNVSTAILGEEVRGSLRDAIEAMNDQIETDVMQEITSAKTDVISAIETKRTTSLSTIPDDYTALSDDVNLLKGLAVLTNVITRIGTFYDNRQVSAQGDLDTYQALGTWSVFEFTAEEDKWYRIDGLAFDGRLAFLQKYTNKPNQVADHYEWFTANEEDNYVLFKIPSETFNTNVTVRVTLPMSGKSNFYLSNGEELIKESTINVNVPYIDEEIENITERVNSFESKVIECIGDSQTGGSVYGGSSYPALLKSNHLTDYTIRNYGNGGETVNAIAWRCGVLPLYIMPFTLPMNTSNLVSVTKKLANDRPLGGLFSAWNNANPVTVGGIPCYCDANGRIYRVSNGSNDVTFDRPVLALPPTPIDKNNCYKIILIGQNGGFSSLSQYINIVNSIVDKIQNKKYIVIPPYTKSFLVSRLNSMSYNDFLSTMYDNFGDHVFDLRSYLVSHGLADNNLTPTTADNTAILNGEVPPQLYADQDVHLNDYGLTAHAKGLYLFGKDLGYWE